MREKLMELINEYFDEAEHHGMPMPKTLGGLLYDMMVYNKHRS